MRKKAFLIVIAICLYLIAILVKFNNELINTIIFIISYLIVRVWNIKKSHKKYF